MPGVKLAENKDTAAQDERPSLRAGAPMIAHLEAHGYSDPMAPWPIRRNLALLANQTDGRLARLARRSMDRSLDYAT